MPSNKVSAAMDIRVEVRVWLARRKQTQTWLAGRLGMSKGNLSRIVNGRQPISARVDRRLRRLGVFDAPAPVPAAEVVAGAAEVRP